MYMFDEVTFEANTLVSHSANLFAELIERRSERSVRSLRTTRSDTSYRPKSTQWPRHGEVFCTFGSYGTTRARRSNSTSDSLRSLLSRRSLKYE